MFKSAIETLRRGVKKSYDHRHYIPTDAIVFLTYRCTGQCSSCNIWRRPTNINDELSWEQWRLAFENLKRNDIKSVELFGGDALLRKELLINMVRFCTENGMKTFFPTNSIGLNKEVALSLLDAGLGTIYFSLDETPNIGGTIRGVATHHDKVLDGIKLFKSLKGNSSNLNISCITTVSSSNFRYLETLLHTAYDSGVDEYIVRGISEFSDRVVDISKVDGIGPSPYFMPTDGKTRSFSETEAKEFLDILQRIERFRPRYAPMHIDLTNVAEVDCQNLLNLTYRHQACVFATTQVVISPYGNVLPCLYYKNYHLGNIAEEDLSKIWGNEKHQRFCRRQQQKSIPLCEYCSIKYYHKPFIPTLREAVKTAVKRVDKIVHRMTGNNEDE